MCLFLTKLLHSYAISQIFNNNKHKWSPQNAPFPQHVKIVLNHFFKQTLLMAAVPLPTEVHYIHLLL